MTKAHNIRNRLIQRATLRVFQKAKTKHQPLQMCNKMGKRLLRPLMNVHNALLTDVVIRSVKIAKILSVLLMSLATISMDKIRTVEIVGKMALIWQLSLHFR